jgi:hypothetical protein
MNVCATCKFYKKSIHEFAGAAGIPTGWCNIKLPMAIIVEINDTVITSPNFQTCDLHKEVK